ncbi:hypothetical protein SK3146_03032 [Paenibacillus konkukensis]|uniref:Uncharacterized protein n=1 Tax=Paenibacillus konkukensis TaxID=2020716 RepID=A0ABY4RPA6_9BACL|nr:hypothetical protein SK3146_03032 [Paenibacillus konkukensis]
MLAARLDAMRLGQEQLQQTGKRRRGSGAGLQQGKQLLVRHQLNRRPGGRLLMNIETHRAGQEIVHRQEGGT